jgi:4-carboxymuconolactone decarboxylase
MAKAKKAVAKKVKPKPANPRVFKKGLDIRRQVLGKDYVDNSLANANEFMMAFQEITTEYCWGYVWGRDGLTKKQRSMLNLGMLAALNRGPELRLHINGAITNGVTKDEMKEIFLQVGIYCGIPACLDAFKTADEVFKERGV